MSVLSPGSPGKRSFLPSLTRRKPISGQTKLLDAHRSRSADIWPPLEPAVQLPKFRDPKARLYEEKQFRNTRTYAEQKLREALDNAGDAKDILPNTALLATAMHCLEALSGEEGQLADLLKTIQALITPAVYCIQDAEKGAISYEQMDPYFLSCRAAIMGGMALKTESKEYLDVLKHEKMELKESIKQLSHTIETQDTQYALLEQAVHHKGQEAEIAHADLKISRSDQQKAEFEASSLRDSTFVIEELKLELEKATTAKKDWKDRSEMNAHMLQVTTQENYALQAQVDDMVPMANYAALAAELAEAINLKETLLGDWQLFDTELTKMQNKIEELESLKETFTPRMDGEHEVILRNKLRQHKIKVPGDIRNSEFAPLFVTALQQIDDETVALRRQAAQGTAGSGGGSGGKKSGKKAAKASLKNEETFTGLGDGMDFPPYLQAVGPVRNISLSTDQVRMIAAEALTQLHVGGDNATNLKGALNLVMTKYAEQLNHPVAAVSYSFFSAAYSLPLVDVELFREIYDGSVDYAVNDEIQQQFDVLEKLIRDAAKHAQFSGENPSGGGLQISAAALKKCLQEAFTVKSPDQLRKLEFQIKSAFGKEAFVQFETLLEPTSEILLSLREQHVEELEEYEDELRAAVTQADVAHVGLISFEVFCDAVRAIDPAIDLQTLTSLSSHARAGALVKVPQFLNLLHKNMRYRTTRAPSEELQKMVQTTRLCVTRRVDVEGNPVLGPKFVQEIFERYATKGSAVTAVTEKTILYALLELCLLYGLDRSSFQAASSQVGIQAETKGRVVPLRISLDQLLAASVGQVSNRMLGQLEGCEWTCRRFNEESGEVAYSEILQLLKALNLMSTLDRTMKWNEWVRVVNRKIPVSIDNLLTQWLLTEDNCCDLEGERVAQLLATIREITGNDTGKIDAKSLEKSGHRLLTRSECSEFTKRLAPTIALAPLSAVLGAIPDPCDYLSLIEAWVDQNVLCPADESVANFV